MPWWTSGRARVLAIAASALILISAPVWGPPLLSTLAFFRVRSVEMVGLRYLSPGQVIALLGVDTTWSVWGDHQAALEQLRDHALVATVRLDRRLPSTLIVRVTERVPVALVPGTGGFVAVDGAGLELPIDPSATALDLPVIPRKDAAVLRTLDEMRIVHPRLYEQLSAARRADARSEDIVLVAGAVRILVPADVGSDRLAELALVQDDLSRRGVRVAELDLRYRDQVIARAK